MRDAVIVSTARTAIGRAYKGGFNDTKGATLGSYSLKPAIERAKIDPGEVQDVVWGAALQQGAQAGNLGRQVALRSGCPIGVSGMTIDRQCSSGLMTIATAAKQVIVDNMDVVAAGGSGIDQPGADQGNAGHARPGTDGDARRDLHADAANCRNRGAALRHLARAAGRIRPAVAAADRRRAGSGQVR